METQDLTHFKSLVAKLPHLKKEIGKVIVGQQDVINEILISLLAGGHCLLEGVPGLAKTLMVKTMAEALEMKFKRVQFANRSADSTAASMVPISGKIVACSPAKNT